MCDFLLRNRLRNQHAITLNIPARTPQELPYVVFNGDLVKPFVFHR